MDRLVAWLRKNEAIQLVRLRLKRTPTVDQLTVVDGAVIVLQALKLAFVDFRKVCVHL